MLDRRSATLPGVADLSDVVHAVKAWAAPVTVIGVDGHSAAGKSTLAAALAAELDPAVLVHGDDFYRVMDESERADLGPAQGADLYYDWQRLRDDVLVPLSAGRPATFQPYDWDNNQLSVASSTIHPAPVIIVEGLFVSRPELKCLIDFTVLVAADEASRAHRQHDRADASPAWLQRWDAAERWYFDTIRPAEAFDAVLPGQ